MEEELKNDLTQNGTEAPVPEETPPPPRVFVVGLGQTGRELITRLLPNLPVFGLDVEARKQELMEQKAGQGKVQCYSKDATSRLTWEELGLSPLDTVVTVTRRDEVNLEACRIAREHFQVTRLISIVHSTRRVEEYSAAGIETVSRAAVLASFIEARVLRDRRTAVNVGLGQGEIMEIPILPGSPVIGRPLHSFHARPWLVAAIYRKDQLIVPHGRSVIREGDRVILVGEPHILAGVAEFFKMGEPGFPLQFGNKIGVLAGAASGAEPEAILSESNYLARNTKATALVLLRLPGEPDPDLAAAQSLCGDAEVSCEPPLELDAPGLTWTGQFQNQVLGCLVLLPKNFGLLKRLGLRNSPLLKILEEANFPILISRGTHPYQNILLSVVMKSNLTPTLELAISLTRQFQARLGVVTVTEPSFAAGKEAVAEQQQVLTRAEELSALYRLPIQIHRREGNPIQEVTEQAASSNLLVMGYRQSRKRRLMPRLDVALEIMARVSCSVMILPFAEENP